MIFKQEQLRELQDSIDILEFYREMLPDLKVRGRRAVSLCYRHSETKPSLFIDLDTGVCHCFSCNYSGNIYQFYKDFYNITFQEAVLEIAKKYNYELEQDEETKQLYAHREKCYSLNEAVLKKFKKHLYQNNEAYNYLTQIRDLSPKIIEDYEIGLGISSLYPSLEKRGKTEGVIQMGLARKGENGYYSTFGDTRVVIPFRDEFGKLVSFCGRYWVENMNGAKYMYTTDTDIFCKRDYLFGLYQAKKYIKHSGSVILCEGQIDLLKLHQKGILNSVCLGGLNISSTQINKLKKYTNTFYFCLEDSAPLRDHEDSSTHRRITILDTLYNTIKEQIPYAKFYVVDLRKIDGTKCDPDEYLQTHTRDEFRELMHKSKIYNEFIINSKIHNLNPKNIDEKSKCINILIPYLRQIPDFITRKQYIELISNKLEVSENDIYRKLKYKDSQQHKLEIQQLTYDKKPDFAQKMLLTACFCNNLVSFNAVFLVYKNAMEFMKESYKNMFKLIAHYANLYYKQNGTKDIDYKNFFLDLNSRDDIVQEYKDTLIQCYIKTEELEDLEPEDLGDFIDEQVETLKEYEYNTEDTLENTLETVAM